MSTSDFNVKVGVRNPSTKKKVGVLLKILNKRVTNSRERKLKNSKTLLR